MKKISLILTIILLGGTMFSGAYFNSINGWSESNDIVIKWETGVENNLDHFTVERKTPNSSFVPINNIEPKGNNSVYKYIDEGLFKTDSDIYIYRIAIYENNNPTPAYSQEIAVSHSLSFVKRTWGSIKAMFR